MVCISESVLRKILSNTNFKHLVIHRLCTIGTIFIETHNIAVRLPHGVEVVVGVSFVGSDLGDIGKTGGFHTIILSAIPRQEVGRTFRNGLGLGTDSAIVSGFEPTLESVALTGGQFARGKAVNVHSLIDVKGLVRGIAPNCVSSTRCRTRNDIKTVLTVSIFAAVIHIPYYKCRRLRFFQFIMGFELDGIDVFTGIAASFCSGIIKIHDKLSARIHIGSCRDKCAAVPTLQFPIGELVASGGRRGSLSHHTGGVQVLSGVCRCSRTAIGIIYNINAIGAINNLTPTGIKVQLAGNPETVS